MKKTSLLKTALLAAVSIGLFAGHARAALTTYNKADLFIGFYDASGNATQDYLYNIGAASTYRDATPGSTISLTAVGSDLITMFGSDWNTNQDIRWFVFGAAYNADVATGLVTDPAWTLYMGSEELTVGTYNPAYAIGSTSAQAGVGNSINDLATLFKGKTSNGVATNSLKQNAALNNSLVFFSNGTLLFDSTYVTGGFGAGTAGTALDLFRMRGDSPTSTSELGSREGRFTINDSGAVTFTATAPVPEPSTYGLFIGAGAILLIAVRRFRGNQIA
ncbi:MAG: PEP-CTERM sorting domain-containing protein [Chthoniobacterales bacterium]